MAKQRENSQNLFVIFLKYYLPLIVWAGVIFFFSSFQGNPSAVYKSEVIFWERKGAHVVEFFILTLLLSRVFKLYYSKKIISLVGWSIIGAILYSFSDEFHQLFVFGRESRVRDMGFDFIGITLAAAWIIFIYNRKKIGLPEVTK